LLPREKKRRRGKREKEERSETRGHFFLAVRQGRFEVDCVRERKGGKGEGKKEKEKGKLRSGNLPSATLFGNLKPTRMPMTYP